MSVVTFESAVSPDATLIRKPLAGAVFVKRYEAGDTPVTQVYTSAGGLIIPADYEDVGLTSKSSGLRFGRDTDTADVESWGHSQPTRRDMTTDVTTLQFTMQESKRVVFELHQGVDLTAVKPDAQGNVIIDKPRAPLALDWRVFVLSKDGDGPTAIYWLDWLPNATVSGVENQEYGDSELSYTVTMTAFEDPAVRTAHRKVWGGPGLDPTAMGFLPAAP